MKPHETDESIRDDELRLQSEVDFDVDLDSDGLAIFCCGGKSPLLYSIHGGGVQSRAQGACDFDVARQTVAPDDQPQHDDPLLPGLACFLRIIGIWIVDRTWRFDVVLSAVDVLSRRLTRIGSGLGLRGRRRWRLGLCDSCAECERQSKKYRASLHVVSCLRTRRPRCTHRNHGLWNFGD